MRNLFIALATAGCLSAPALAADENIWSTTVDTGSPFETTGPFPWSGLNLSYGGATFQSVAGFPGFGTQMLRNDTGGTTRFEANGLGTHTALRLKFDLAFIDSRDSLDGACCAPDILFVTIDGTEYQWTVNNALGTVFDVGPGTVLSKGVQSRLQQQLY